MNDHLDDALSRKAIIKYLTKPYIHRHYLLAYASFLDMYSPQGLSKRFSPELIDGRNSTTDYGRNTIPVNTGSKYSRLFVLYSYLPKVF